eukprot:UN03585
MVCDKDNTAVSDWESLIRLRNGDSADTVICWLDIIGEKPYQCESCLEYFARTVKTQGRKMECENCMRKKALKNEKKPAVVIYEKKRQKAKCYRTKAHMLKILNECRITTKKRAWNVHKNIFKQS